MIQKNVKGLLYVIGTAALLMQCNKASQVEPTDENELITTVQLSFKESGVPTAQTFTYRDIDGDGGNPPTNFDKIVLKPNTTYTLSVGVLDESKSPAVNIGQEILAKADEHLFVFTPAPTALLSYQYGDKDARNFPIGLTGTITTGAIGTGKLKVQLRHQPPVGGAAVKDGTAGPGSDDINLDFDLEIK